MFAVRETWLLPVVTARREQGICSVLFLSFFRAFGSQRAWMPGGAGPGVSLLGHRAKEEESGCGGQGRSRTAPLWAVKTRRGLEPRFITAAGCPLLWASIEAGFVAHSRFPPSPFNPSSSSKCNKSSIPLAT